MSSRISCPLPVLGTKKLVAAMPHRSHADIVRKRNQDIATRFDALYRARKFELESETGILTLGAISKVHETAINDVLDKLADEFYLAPRTIMSILKKV